MTIRRPRRRNPDRQLTTEVLRIKAAVRARDGHRCVCCGLSGEQYRNRCGRRLDVHRLSPGSLYTVEGCVTLCRRCHGPQPHRPLGAVDQADPGKVRLPTDLVKKLRTIAALKNEMGERFKAVDFLNGLVVDPIEALYEQTVKAFATFQTKQTRERKRP